MEPILLKPEEAASALKISRTRVYEMAAAGELPTVRLRGSVRIPADALRRWISDLMEGPDEPTKDAPPHGDGEA